MSEVRPIDVVRADVDQLHMEFSNVQKQLAWLLIAVAMLTLLVAGGLLWRR